MQRTKCLPAHMLVFRVKGSTHGQEAVLKRYSEYVRKNIIIPKLLRDPGEGLQSLDSIANYSIMKAGEKESMLLCCLPDIHGLAGIALEAFTSQ